MRHSLQAILTLFFSAKDAKDAKCFWVGGFGTGDHYAINVNISVSLNPVGFIQLDQKACLNGYHSHQSVVHDNRFLRLWCL
jgi:hypothetical protein